MVIVQNRIKRHRVNNIQSVVVVGFCHCGPDDKNCWSYQACCSSPRLHGIVTVAVANLEGSAHVFEVFFGQLGVQGGGLDLYNSVHRIELEI